MVINSKKTNLIILRCGKNSLHKRWISTGANYDLFLLPYEHFVSKTEKNCTLFPLVAGQKWPAISKFIKDNIKLISHYDFIKTLLIRRHKKIGILKQVFTSNTIRYLATLPKENKLPNHILPSYTDVLDDLSIC